jgi:hypothetical protein
MYYRFFAMVTGDPWSPVVQRVKLGGKEELGRSRFFACFTYLNVLGFDGRGKQPA